MDSNTSPKVPPELEVITKEMRISISKNETFSAFAPKIYTTLSQQGIEINDLVLQVSRERGYQQISVQRISADVYKSRVSVI